MRDLMIDPAVEAPRATRIAPRRRTAPVPQPVTSRRIELRRRDSVDTALAKVLTATRAHWTANLPALVADSEIDAVHQFRVGLRRFRSALRLFKSRIEPEQRDWLDREAKWILSGLGLTRDLDVLLSDLIPAAAGRAKDDEFNALRAVARRARAIAYRSAARVVQSSRYRRFMIRLDMWLDGAGWRAPHQQPDRIDALARQVMTRRLGKLIGRGDSLSRMTADERHDTRIAVKKCRYGLEFFDDVLPARMASTIGPLLKSVQDSLGHANDIVTATALLATFAKSKLQPDVRRDVARAGRTLLDHHGRLERRADRKADRQWAKLRRALAEFKIRA